MNNQISTLPALGIGASLSLTSQPDPVKLAAAPGGPAFIEYAGQADVDAVKNEVNRIRASDIPVLFHPAYLNFCGSFANHQEWLTETARHLQAVESPWLAQDLAYCFWQEGPGYSTQLGYFLPPVFNQSSLNQAVERIREVQSAVPVPVAIEPPPMTFVAGTLPLLEFFGELAKATDCALLLDMGHLVSYEMASGRKIADESRDFPWQRVIEIHVAGGRIEQAGQPVAAATTPVYIDAHEQPILPATWEMFTAILPRCSNLKAICFECEGSDQPRVLETLATIRGQVARFATSRGLLDAVNGRNEQAG